MTKIMVKGKGNATKKECCETDATVSWKLMVHKWNENHMKQRRVAFLASTVVRTSSICGKCELTLATDQAKGGGREREREGKTTWNVSCETIVIDKCSFFILASIYDYLLTPFFFISFLLPLKLVYDIFAIILEIPLRDRHLIINYSMHRPVLYWDWSCGS